MAEEITIRIGAQDNASEAFRRAGEQLGLLGQKADETKTKAASLTSSLGSLSGGTAQLVGGFSVLGNGFGGLISGMTSIQAGARNIVTGFEGLRGSASGLAIGLGVGLVGAATALGASVYSAVTRAAELGDQLRDMSLQSGVSVESLSTLRFAAEQSNIGLGDLNTGLRFLSRNAVEAADGTGAQAEAFKNLGVKVTNAAGNMRSADAIMMDVADGLKSLASDTDRSALAMQVFGRSGTQLLPFLREGSAGIQEMQQRAKDLGLEMSTDSANAADAFGDSLDELKEVFGSVGQRIGVVLLPAFVLIIRGLVDVATSVGDTATILAEFGGIAFEPLRQGFAIVIDYIRAGVIGVVNFLGINVTAGINALIRTFNSFGEKVGITIDTIDFTPLTAEAPQEMSDRWDESKRRVTEGFSNIQAAGERIANRFANNPLGVDTVEQGTRQIARAVETELTPKVETLKIKVDAVDDSISELAKTLDKPLPLLEFPIPPPPPPNMFIDHVRSLGRAFTEPAGKDVIQTAMVNAFTNIAEGGSWKDSIAAVGVAIGASVGGPVGAAIAGFVTRGLFAGSTYAGKTYKGIAGEAVQAVELGGIGKLVSPELTGQQRRYRGAVLRGGERTGRIAINAFADELIAEIPSLTYGEAQILSQAMLEGRIYGADGQALNQIIRGALIRESITAGRISEFRASISSAAVAILEGGAEGSVAPRTTNLPPVIESGGVTGGKTLSLSGLASAARSGQLSTTLEAQGIAIGSGLFNNVLGLLQGDSAARSYLTSQGYTISAQGGLFRVPGGESQPIPAILHGGEMVIPARQAEAVRSGRDLAGGVTVNFYLQSASDREMVQMIRSQLPMIEQAVSQGIQKGSRFGLQEFDSRMIRTTLQS